jgi:cell wall-associated NlpC family hydrolase
LLIVSVFEDRILEEPKLDSQAVSDVVMGDLVTKTGGEGEWDKVQLPDGRTGFLAKKSTENYSAWKNSRRPTPEEIERTGRLFLGRPYLWGGNSPKGLDCSGFAKLVFFLNGITLNRNASQQARQGVEVPTEGDFSHLKKGDLLFFGRTARRSEPEWITHVGIYLGEKLFIQSSERVRISSLDPKSPIYDAYHGRTLLFARRVLDGGKK